MIDVAEFSNSPCKNLVPGKVLTFDNVLTSTCKFSIDLVHIFVFTCIALKFAMVLSSVGGESLEVMCSTTFHFCTSWRPEQYV